MSKLHGTIVDSTTGEPCAGRVQVLGSSGEFISPQGSILKVGSGLPFFYCEGEFTVDVPVGPVQVLVERGTEYIPVRRSVDASRSGTLEVTLSLERWTDLPRQGWHPGNTHIHYDEKELDPDGRLRLEPHVNDLSLTAISILKRGNLDYATNRYPLGMLTDFSTAHHTVISGEESRHNSEPWVIGYGHIMLLNIRNVVEPVSRGLLVDRFSPDYPPLCYACDEARDQGGVVIWCHCGNGMEASVAAALGKLDAFNLFDPNWMEPEYDIWYKLLACGIRLPASSGTDWFVCSNNRVYVNTGGPFTYEGWLEGLKKGRTFITNGPALSINANGATPGDTLETSDGPVEVEVTWKSHYPLHKIELVHDGKVVEERAFPQGTMEGKWATKAAVSSDGWLGARCNGDSRDSFHRAAFAHTSPIYIRMGQPSGAGRESAAFLASRLDEAMTWVDTCGRFSTGGQRREVLELFHRGQDFYQAISAGSVRR